MYIFSLSLSPCVITLLSLRLFFFKLGGANREYGTAIEKERHAQALQLWKNFPIMPADSQKEAELEIHAVIESKESIDAALSSLSDTSETHSFFMNNLNSTRQADDKAHSLPSSPDPLISGDGPRSASVWTIR